MAFNPRPTEEARNEVQKPSVLKPIPKNISTLGEMVEYYIQLSEKDSKDKTVSICATMSTRNIKHVLSLIIKYGYNVLYLKRADGIILWDKR